MATQHRFVTLDGMRGIAAVAVVTLHMPTFFHGSPLPSASLAVDFFFALSGFVLAHAYDQPLRRGMGALAFMRERLFRLYPLYFLGSAFGLAVFALFGLFGDSREVSSTAYIVSIGTASVFLPSPVPLWPDMAFPLLPPAWSLFYELAANLVYALIARWLTGKVLAGLICVAAVALVLTGLHYGDLNVGPYWKNFAGGAARVSFGFFVGIAVQRIFRAGLVPMKLPTPLLIAALVATMAFPLGVWGQLAVALIGVPALVLLGAAAAPGPRTSAIYLALGAASYPLYTIHRPIMQAIKRGLIFLHFDGAVSSPLLGAAIIAALIGAALVLERYYERPVRKALKWIRGRFIAGKPAALRG